MWPVLGMDQHMNSRDFAWNCDKLVWPAGGLHFEEGIFVMLVLVFKNEKARATIKTKSN